MTHHMTDHLTFGLRKENQLHVAQRRKTKNVPWDKSSHNVCNSMQIFSLTLHVLVCRCIVAKINDLFLKFPLGNISQILSAFTSNDIIIEITH
jgi:hypothetical protein